MFWLQDFPTVWWNLNLYILSSDFLFTLFLFVWGFVLLNSSQTKKKALCTKEPQSVLKCSFSKVSSHLLWFQIWGGGLLFPLPLSPTGPHKKCQSLLGEKMNKSLAALKIIHKVIKETRSDKKFMNNRIHIWWNFWNSKPVKEKALIS